MDPMSLISAGGGVLNTIMGATGLFKSGFQSDQEAQARADWARKNKVFDQYQGIAEKGAQDPGIQKDSNQRLALMDPWMRKQMSQQSRSMASQMSQRFGSGGGVSGMGMAGQQQVQNDYNLARDQAQLQTIQDAINTRFGALSGSISAVNAGGGAQNGATLADQSRFQMLGDLYSGGTGMAMWGLNGMLNPGKGPGGMPQLSNIPNPQLQYGQQMTNPMQFWNPKGG